MPHQEDEKAFTVKDRRRFDASGNPRESEAAETLRAQPAAQPPVRSAEAPGASERSAPPRSAPEPRHAEPTEGEGGIDFSEFILSLATNAIVHLGGDPRDGRIPGRVNLPLAAQHIDIIGMLAQKTRGNLTRDEAELVESLLYDLRMKYVSVAQSQSRGR